MLRARPLPKTLDYSVNIVEIVFYLIVAVPIVAFVQAIWVQSYNRAFFYVVWYGAPLLFMANCQGWSTSDGAVKQCLIDTFFMRAIADFLYLMVFGSVVLLGIPAIFYTLFGLSLGTFFSKPDKNESLH